MSVKSEEWQRVTVTNCVYDKQIIWSTMYTISTVHSIRVMLIGVFTNLQLVRVFLQSH